MSINENSGYFQKLTLAHNFSELYAHFGQESVGSLSNAGFTNMRNGNIVAKLALREVSINLFIQYKTFQLYNDHFVSLIRREDVYAETELVSSRNALNGFAFRWTAY